MPDIGHTFSAADRLIDLLTAGTRAAAPERREAAEQALAALHRATTPLP